jgi:prophage regulatory protein
MPVQRPGGKRALNLKAVMDKTGKGHTAIYDEMHRGIFPKPIRYGSKAVRWLEHEVDAYLDARAAERDAAE